MADYKSLTSALGTVGGDGRRREIALCLVNVLFPRLNRRPRRSNLSMRRTIEYCDGAILAVNLLGLGQRLEIIGRRLSRVEHANTVRHALGSSSPLCPERGSHLVHVRVSGKRRIFLPRSASATHESAWGSPVSSANPRTSSRPSSATSNSARNQCRRLSPHEHVLAP